jgi:hypothetical protein
MNTLLPTIEQGPKHLRSPHRRNNDPALLQEATNEQIQSSNVLTVNNIIKTENRLRSEEIRPRLQKHPYPTYPEDHPRRSYDFIKYKT